MSTALLCKCISKQMMPDTNKASNLLASGRTRGTGVFVREREMREQSKVLTLMFSLLLVSKKSCKGVTEMADRSIPANTVSKQSCSKQTLVITAQA